MHLTEQLAPARRRHVETRLQTNLMAWLGTVSPGGRPDTVPVWFLFRADDSVLLYSKPGTVKLRNIAGNARVSLGLDVTDIGRDVIRLEGVAEVVENAPPAHHVPEYLAKYAERAAAIFGTVEEFAELFNVAVVITPTRLHAG